MKKSALIFCLLTMSFCLSAQKLLKVCDKSKNLSGSAFFNKSISQDIQVIHCDLHLKIDPDTLYLSGYNTISYTTLKEAVKEVSFDLSSNLNIDSITYMNQSPKYRHENHQVFIEVDSSLGTGSIDSLRIYYSGAPQSDGLGTFVQDSYNGVDSIIWTLSQPYGAAAWWPCRNNLYEKVDSIDLHISTPIKNQVASNGLLLQIDTLGDWATYHWKSSYPIASYLVAIAVTNYEIHSSKKALGQDSLLFQHFLYPNDTLSQTQSESVSLPFLQFFDSLFGTYPFIREKYGHASFTFGGGMEHQTMSFMGSYGGELIAHELAHQWFGNKVTCGSWTDLWLNEAFATYLTMLTYEFGVLHDPIYLPQVLQGFRNISFLYPNASVYRSDTTDASALFTRVPYFKGASLLHMLRFKLGDQAFFTGIRNYINRPDLEYGFARTRDLQTELEASSGTVLDEFFKDWFYGKGYPSYSATWAQDNGKLQIRLDQSQSDPSVYFFNMPIPYQVLGPNLDTTIILDPNFSGQYFEFNMSKSIDSLVFDPEKWIGAKSEVINSLEELEAASEDFQFYPNPNRGILHLSSKQLSEIKALTIYSLEGKFITQLPIQSKIHLGELPAGSYFLQGQFQNKGFSKKIIIW